MARRVDHAIEAVGPLTEGGLRRPPAPVAVGDGIGVGATPCATSRGERQEMKEILPNGGETGPNRSDARDAPDLIPHTQVHALVRRTLENLQDVIVCLVLAVLLLLSLRALWRLARMATIEAAPSEQLLSEIMFVLILTEVYRLLIFYLSDHRISVALTVEVALVSTLREVILKGAHEFDWRRILGLSLLLVVLGGLLAMERWTGRSWDEGCETDAR
jgi:uncharacterized membrane protein (DUF373 family)